MGFNCILIDPSIGRMTTHSWLAWMPYHVRYTLHWFGTRIPWPILTSVCWPDGMAEWVERQSLALGDQGIWISRFQNLVESIYSYRFLAMHSVLLGRTRTGWLSVKIMWLSQVMVLAAWFASLAALWCRYDSPRKGREKLRSWRVCGFIDIRGGYAGT